MLTVYDFYSKSCGPCKMVLNYMDEFTTKYSFNLVKIDAEVESELAEKFQVSSVPTLVFMKDNKEFHRESGFKPKPVIEKIIKSES